MKIFEKEELKKLYKPKSNSSGEDNGQVTVIGGSNLFHGAPFLSLKAASRIVDMVFFSSPEPSIGEISNKLKSKLFSFIWVPWNEIEKYIEKSDAVLIGPGMMRFGSEAQNTKSKYQIRDNSPSSMSNFDETGMLTRDITKHLLLKFPNKKWVIDAGSLQTMEAEWIPKKSILTPNIKEMEILFGKKNIELGITNIEDRGKIIRIIAQRYKCVIVAKGSETIVSDGSEIVIVKGGNAGLTKGGTGDILAGLTVGLLAKNDPLLAASAASYLEKAAADDLYKKAETNYNADDLANKIPITYKKLLRR